MWCSFYVFILVCQVVVLDCFKTLSTIGQWFFHSYVITIIKHFTCPTQNAVLCCSLKSFWSNRIFAANLVWGKISRAQESVWISHFARPRTQAFWQGFNRSHKRGRRPQTRGLRGLIEIAKCAIFRSNCATLNVPISRGEPREFARLSCGISGHGRLFCNFIWVLSELLWTFRLLHISTGNACTV